MLGLRCIVGHRLGHGFVFPEFMVHLVFGQFMFMLMLMFMLAEFVLMFMLAEQSAEPLACESAKGAGQRARHNFANDRRRYAGHAS